MTNVPGGRPSTVGVQALAPSVFLSFTIAHKPLVDRFRDQARGRARLCDLLECSTRVSGKDAWKVHVDRLIRSSLATICLVGEGTWRSDPVNWEIRRSTELGKRVLAMYLRPDVVRTPQALADIGVRPVPWDADAVVASLREGVRRVD